MIEELVMDKFLVALPRSSVKHHHQPAGSTKSDSTTAVNPGSSNDKLIGVKRSPPDDQKENKTSSSAHYDDDDMFEAPTKKTANGKKLQMYLDFGQKSLNETIQCPRCNLLYMKHDLEDLKQHERYCERVDLPPQLAAATIKTLQLVTEWTNDNEKIVWAKKAEKETKGKLKDSTGYNPKTFFKTTAIGKLMETMKFELGAADEFVRIIYELPFTFSKFV